MQRWHILIICVSLHLFGKLWGAAVSNNNGDFGIWNYDAFLLQSSPCSQFLVSSNFRAEKEATRFYFFRQHFEYMWFPKPCFAIGPAYRQVFFQQLPSYLWAPAYYPNMNFYLLWNTQHFNWRHRSRIAYTFCHLKIFEHGVVPGWVYRDQLWVETKQGYSYLNVHGLAAAEFFFIETLGFEEYRLTIGALGHLYQQLQWEVGYRYLSNKNFQDMWSHKNIVILNLRGQF